MSIYNCYIIVKCCYGRICSICNSCLKWCIFIVMFNGCINLFPYYIISFNIINYCMENFPNSYKSKLTY